ncbi:MAG: hypothetical protein WC121_09390 [Candidatus Kapaibacterium sp.]
MTKEERYYREANKNYVRALEYEKYFRYEKACQFYEQAIQEDEKYVSQDMFINLAFIYWRASYGFEPSDNDFIFPYYLRKYGEDNYQSILIKGIERYPNNLELRFWELYFNYSREYGDEDIYVEKYFSTISNLINLYEPSTNVEENYSRTLGYKIEYLFFYLYEHSRRTDKRFPNNFDTILKKIFELTSNPDNCKNRYIYETISPFFE